MATRIHAHVRSACLIFLVLTPGIASADPDAPRAKIVDIAAKEADSRLRMRHQNECHLHTPEDATFVDPKAADVVARDSTYFVVTFKGKTAEGFEYDVSYEVVRTGSGSLNPIRVVTKCPPKK